MKSQATGDLELNIPQALQKMASKIERSGIACQLVMGVGKLHDLQSCSS